MLELCRRAREASGGWFDPWAPAGRRRPHRPGQGLGRRARPGRGARRRRRRRHDQRRRRHRRVRRARSRASRGAWAYATRWPPTACSPSSTLGGHDRAVATSGTYERGLHVLDPDSGEPAQGLLAATVVGPDLAFVDALATGLLASGGKALARVAGTARLQRADRRTATARCARRSAFRRPTLRSTGWPEPDRVARA